MFHAGCVSGDKSEFLAIRRSRISGSSMSYTTTVNMDTRSVRSVVSLLAASLIVTTVAAQTAQLKVFRGTLVHSRVRTEMEVLEDFLIGFNESNLGRVSSNIL